MNNIGLPPTQTRLLGSRVDPLPIALDEATRLLVALNVRHGGQAELHVETRARFTPMSRRHIHHHKETSA
ncbi:MAG: hypothetical protein JWM89_1747 [Acidimicrobiales bacterium]|nr:hypothetical protein [Acidimicrobiales bacterium]